MSLESPSLKKKFELLPQGASLGRGAHEIKKKRVLIGRSQACDIVLPFPDITAIHAIVEILDESCKLYDMNSTNGSYINGSPALTGEFKVGDKIKFASHEFEFKDFEVEDIPNLPLRMLSTGMPPVIAETEAQFGVQAEVKDEPARALPEAPVRTSSKEEFIPRVEYPLSQDPDAEFSEYIFEDVEQLYPIFNYETQKSSVEIVILFKDRIYSVDYLPTSDGEYRLVGRSPSASEIEYCYLGKDEKISFVTIRDGAIYIDPLFGYEPQLLSDKEKSVENGQQVLLERDEILRFYKEDLQIFVRNTEAPPAVAHAPIFRRDPALKKYLLLVFLFVSLFMGAMTLFEVDEELEKEKIPERIATILYQKKLNLKKTITPALKKKVKKKSTTLKKKPKPKKLSKKKPTKVSQKKKGSKTTKKVGSVRKATANKGKKDNLKIDQVRPKKSAGGRTSPKKVTSKRTKAPSKSKGNVDTYKSVDFKSTVSSLLSKGGTSKSYKAKKSTATGIDGGSSVVGGESATLKRAKVSGNVGSLSGAASGKLDSSRGAEGLVDKKSIARAGVPAPTVIHGGMDPDIIRQILMNHYPQFQYCYQKALDTASSRFGGVLPLNFIIGASGHVTRATVKNTRGVVPPKVKSCAVGVLKGIKFPEPQGGGVVEVNQPMNFQSQGR